MSWAHAHIDELSKGNTVEFLFSGAGMDGAIEPGHLVTIEPIKKERRLRVGDVILCKVGRIYYLNKILDVYQGRYQIGNAKGRVKGWIPLSHAYGIVVKVSKPI
jgi:hypothetical protein